MTSSISTLPPAQTPTAALPTTSGLYVDADGMVREHNGVVCRLLNTKGAWTLPTDLVAPALPFDRLEPRAVTAREVLTRVEIGLWQHGPGASDRDEMAQIASEFGVRR